MSLKHLIIKIWHIYLFLSYLLLSLSNLSLFINWYLYSTLLSSDLAKLGKNNKLIY